MMFSRKITESLNNSSWIRAMFEEGEKLRQKLGPDKVYDFSLGNPEIEPPEAVTMKLKELVMDNSPGKHRYMSNAGYTDTREKVASYLQKNHGVPLTAENIVMTCGAASALNIVLKTLLNPGEEVLVFSPFFVEYLTYIDNHGGKPVTVPTDPSSFEPDPGLLEKYITPNTKALLINSPNNPTGVIYRSELLEKIARLLEMKEKEYNSTIFVISDEPYARITYDGARVPSVFQIFKNSIIVNSFSKSLAIPGERIGYAAASSRIENVETLVNGMIYCNRTLGFVNAPALFQKVIAGTMDETIDVEWYKKRRDILYNHLTKIGFSCIKPQGAFYLFPKSLIEDDVEFVRQAVKYNLLLVPGRGFGCPGHFRIAFCVSMKTIENSLPAFEALASEFMK